MNCLQAKEYFSAHFEDTLDKQILHQLKSHMAECASCQKEYNLFQASVKATQQLPEIDPAPNFVPLLLQRISEETIKNIPFWQRVYDLFKIPKWAIGSVLILVLAGAGTFYYYDAIFNAETQSNDTIVYPDNISAKELQNVITDQFFPRGMEGSDLIGTNSNQPMQQQYILKRVSYTTPSLAGGL